MGTDADLGTVVQFYDNHPINDDQILGALAAKGIAGDAISEEHLKEFDQDHYGLRRAAKPFRLRGRIDSPSRSRSAAVQRRHDDAGRPLAGRTGDYSSGFDVVFAILGELG